VLIADVGTIFRLKGSIMAISFLDCNGTLMPTVAEPWRDAKDDKQPSTPTRQFYTISFVINYKSLTNKLRKFIKLQPLLTSATEGNGKPLLYFAKTTMLVQNKTALASHGRQRCQRRHGTLRRRRLTSGEQQ